MVGKIKVWLYIFVFSAKLKLCADGAVNRLYHCGALGRDDFVPDIISGDFDSAEETVIQYYKEKVKVFLFTFIKLDSLVAQVLSWSICTLAILTETWLDLKLQRQGHSLKFICEYLFVLL